MATKGAQARERVIKTIQQAFGENFVGINDKKLYVNQSEDDGAIYQFAIAITMPKNKIEKYSSYAIPENIVVPENVVGEADPTIVKPKIDVVSQEEIDIVDQLLKDLGI